MTLPVPSAGKPGRASAPRGDEPISAGCHNLGAFFASLFAIFAGPLSGSFVTLDQCRSPEVWEAEFELMAVSGMDTVIVRESVDDYLHEAFYPTDRVEFQGDCPYDRVGTVMAFAERHDMKVYLGLVFSEGTSSPPPGHQREALLYSSILTARELLARYGDYDSFAGWYLTPEIVANDWVSDRGHYRIDFHRRLVAGIREFDSHPILSAPYFIPYSDWMPISPRQLRDFVYGYSLSTGVNVVLLQDGAGADNRSIIDIDRYFQAAAGGVVGTGVELWADVEAFRIRDGAYVAAPSQEVLDNTLQVKPYVTRSVTWTFQHYMSPYSGRPGAWQAFLGYLTRSKVGH